MCLSSISTFYCFHKAHTDSIFYSLYFTQYKTLCTSLSLCLISVFIVSVPIVFIAALKDATLFLCIQSIVYEENDSNFCLECWTGLFKMHGINVYAFIIILISQLMLFQCVCFCRAVGVLISDMYDNFMFLGCPSAHPLSYEYECFLLYICLFSPLSVIHTLLP